MEVSISINSDYDECNDDDFLYHLHLALKHLFRLLQSMTTQQIEGWKGRKLDDQMGAYEIDWIVSQISFYARELLFAHQYKRDGKVVQ